MELFPCPDFAHIVQWSLQGHIKRCHPWVCWVFWRLKNSCFLCFPPPSIHSSHLLINLTHFCLHLHISHFLGSGYEIPSSFFDVFFFAKLAIFCSFLFLPGANLTNSTNGCRGLLMALKITFTNGCVDSAKCPHRVWALLCPFKSHFNKEAFHCCIRFF